MSSVPSKSKIVTYATNHIAGLVYTITMQSLDSSSNPFDTRSDVYSIEIIRSGGESF